VKNEIFTPIYGSHWETVQDDHIHRESKKETLYSCPYLC